MSNQYESKGFWSTLGELIGLTGLLIHGTKTVVEDGITITTNVSGSAAKLSEVAVLYSDNLAQETAVSMSNNMEAKVETMLQQPDIEGKIIRNAILSDEAKTRLISKLESLEPSIKD